MDIMKIFQLISTFDQFQLYVNSNYTSVTITSLGYVYFTLNSNDHSGNTINGLYFRSEASSLGGSNNQNLNSSDFYPIKSDIN